MPLKSKKQKIANVSTPAVASSRFHEILLHVLDVYSSQQVSARQQVGVAFWDD